MNRILKKACEARRNHCQELLGSIYSTAVNQGEHIPNLMLRVRDHYIRKPSNFKIKIAIQTFLFSAAHLFYQEFVIGFGWLIT
jgi:hypothetical protein